MGPVMGLKAIAWFGVMKRHALTQIFKGMLWQLHEKQTRRVQGRSKEITQEVL